MTTASIEPQISPPLRSIHTSSLHAILDQLGISLWITTYQAGKLVIARAEAAGVNTHFRDFPKPMGLALDGERLALGTATEIWEFHNQPPVASRLEPPERHDACFLPRTAHATGDVQIHEMTWCRGELWFVNTRFSCLCTRSDRYSFVPRWRPRFVSRLVPEDRCHLNGLEAVNGAPRYATALGETDEPGGWRVNKKNGGILLDVAANEVIARGLSMPHSPRWHNGRLWLLESGNGGIGIVDPDSGRYEGIAELPGFTRGLDFCGRFAFIGLSQVRESAVFSGLAITEEQAERACGVWVLDIVSGRVVAFLKFEDAVQEIFAVQVMPGRRWPDLLHDDPKLLADSFILPDEALVDVAEPYRRLVGRSNCSRLQAACGTDSKAVFS
jgi:uncharacterized protein (TIGR03032 family)